MGLTVVTSWVVSSISVWLVPVYVGAMVLIFAVPRTNRPESEREEPTDESGEASPVEDPLVSSSAEVNEKAKADSPAPAVEAEAPSEPPPPKPRKRRVRARRTAKKGANAPDDASTTGRVTWVKVGPGKFVRSVVPVAEFVGPPAPDSISDEPPPAAEIETDASTDAVPDFGAVAPEVGSEGEAGAGDQGGLSVPVPVAESLQPRAESPSISDDSHPAPEPGPDGEPCQDLLMNRDDQARFDEAPEEPVSSDPPEAADVAGDGFVIEHEHESEFTPPDVSEAIAEEHGNAPSAFGESPETVLDFEAGRDEEPSFVDASPPAADAFVDVEDDLRETVGVWAPERSSPVGLLDSPKMEAAGRRSGFGLFFSASLRRPRRTVEPAIVRPSPRFGNVRRSGASRRRAALAGRANETRVRHRADAIRGRRANVKRDFHPRSPPARS